MPKWTIRVKLLAGLSLVVGMMLTLMGGAVFSLSAFHDSNLMLTDLLRELGASKELIRHVARLEAPRDGSPAERQALLADAREARAALVDYFEEGMPHARSLRIDPAEADRLARGTVGLRIAVTRIDARKKLSQNRTDADRDAVIAHLAGDGRYSEHGLAREMTRTEGNHPETNLE